MALILFLLKYDLANYCLNFLVLLCIINNLVLVHGLCGYESCPTTKPGYINVHLVAHSHDDVGWLKTVDQYYHGTRRDIGPESVQYILDSVVVELNKNPQRKFIYVETGFFWRWWKSQSEETKELVTKFVHNGQLEFISGGWSMNDEGSTHYNAIIDQLSLGLRYLNDTFGECAIPKVGWQIDTFGHSRENANIFAQLGWDGVFFGRIDYKDKSHRVHKKEMEMLWMTNPNNHLGESTTLFTGILLNYYQPPTGFCFDQLCKDDPINDDPDLDDYNVDEKVKAFVQIARWWAHPYGTGHTLMTMGSDFHYMNSNMWFKNLDKLIKYVNAHEYKSRTAKKVNVFYSTPSCYLQEVHKSGKVLPLKISDFFPYSNDYFGFWSGYFSSRPTFKYYIHKANNFLQTCKQLAVGAFNGKPNKAIIDQVWNLYEPLAIVQHHDAITGTAKQHVTDDYSKRIAVGMKSCEKVLDASFQNLVKHPNLTLSQSSGNGSYRFCMHMNISTCIPAEEMDEFVLSVYNPRAFQRQDEYIRIPVNYPFWKVESFSGLILPQVVPIPTPVLGIPGRNGTATCELVFKADDLPGLSLTNFKITKTSGSTDFSNMTEETIVPVPHENNSVNDMVISNSRGTTITIDGRSGLLKSVSKGSIKMSVEQNFFYYLGMAGNNSKFEWRASGAYIFRPNTTNGLQPTPIVTKVESYKIFKGTHVTEVHQIFNNWVSQVIRLYDKSDLVEFESLIGPIPIEDGYGKEIITRYSTNLQTKGTFFTDSNGRQLVRRQRDKRDYNFDTYEEVAQNYYPVTSRILISEDEDLPQNKGPALIILNDRSQGGTSMNDGEVELLIHRRLLYDDDFGVGEALNETAFGKGLVTRGKHWLLLAGDGTGVPLSKHREIAQNIFMDNVMGFVDINLFNRLNKLDQSEIQGSHLFSRSTAVSGLEQVLPPNVHLLTLEALSSSQILLRLEHFYENGEDPVNSKPVLISTSKIKQALPFISGLRETTLGANQWIQDNKRFSWKTVNNTGINFATDFDDPVTDVGEILLRPMEIKTFLLDLI